MRFLRNPSTAVTANSRFNLASVDNCAAFFQSRTLDRDVFVKPPPHIKKPEINRGQRNHSTDLMTHCKSCGCKSEECCVSLDSE